MPEELKSRGVDDPTMVSKISQKKTKLILLKIKEYGYREDGLKYWAAIKKYVRGILDIYYKNDADVENDSHIQNWIQDVRIKGFANADDPGIPTRIESVDSLEMIATMLIFALTATESII